MSRKKSKGGNQKESLTSLINLVTAVIKLITEIVSAIEQLNE